MVNLLEEDINRLKDLVEFNDDDVSTMSKVLRKPGGLVSSCSSCVTSPALASAPGMHIRAKALTLLDDTMNGMKYYEMINLKPTEILLRYDPTIKNFKLEFDGIKDFNKKEVSTLQINQKLDDVCWIEAFLDFLSRTT